MKNDYGTYIARLANKEILSDTVCADMTDARLDACTLDGMAIRAVRWSEDSIENSNVNEVCFAKCELKDVNFFRTNLEQSLFSECRISNNTTFSGVALLKTAWNRCRISDVTIMDSTMMRVKMNSCVVERSIFVDYEAVYATIKDCIFVNCRFDVNNMKGMSGFSGSKIENCLFVNCDCTGFPFRGAKTDHCVFIGNSGHLADDMEECIDTVGLDGFCDMPGNMPGKIELKHIPEARKLIERWT